MSGENKSLASAFWARVPAGVRIYAIGDIHGRADLLSKIHCRISADLQNHPHRNASIIYLGDYIDRGPASREVIDLLTGTACPAVQRTFLKGNHEDMMMSFIRNPMSGTTWLLHALILDPDMKKLSCTGIRLFLG